MTFTMQNIVLASAAPLVVMSASPVFEMPERCTLPYDSGPCRAAMPRFYFNTESNKCESLVYGGCMGNENNFFTQSECKLNCEAFVPHQVQEEEEEEEEIEARSFTESDDGCLEEAFSMGRCRAALNRWSWNSETLKCEQFVFGGCDGTGNNYRSQRKCEKTCGYLASQRVMEMDVVDMEEEEEEEEESEEEVETEEARADRVCNLPMKIGLCRARFDRFYYDSASGKCKSFTYGGCEGNDNNFQTRQACKDLCFNRAGMMSDVLEPEEEEEEEPEPEQAEPKSGLSEDHPNYAICSLPNAVGFCRGYFQKWFFDGEKCAQFIYGGCRGNENNFDSQEDCEAMCIQLPEINPRVFEEEEEEESENINPCSLPIQTGPCRALYPRFAFDGENCVPFMYGGCMGNANNFASESACRQDCMMQNDSIETEEEEEEEDEDESTNEMANDMRNVRKQERKAMREQERQTVRNNKKRGRKNKNKSMNRSVEEEDEMRFNFFNDQLTFG